jgi:Fe-coproporphyrin III synthase
VEDERIDRFYLSHLNYAGRGNVNRKRDAHFRVTREALDLLFARAWDAARRGVVKDFVTGNNDADGVYLLHWARSRLPAELPGYSEAQLRGVLAAWGGNSSGVNVANIDNLGNVHPDTMWWDCTLGNVRSRLFSDIWRDTRHPIMAGLKERPRRVKGRCATCAYFDVCGGNTRVRAMKVTGDPWAEDPGCYLDDEEIAASPAAAVHA